MPLRLNSDPSSDDSYARSAEAKNMGVFEYNSEVSDSAIKMIQLF